MSALDARTTTPIKHLVVIFDENVSFDHYFGTCPNDPTYDICSHLPASDGSDGNTPAGTITMGGSNYVDNQIIDQLSIPKFIEDNWLLPDIGNGSTETIAGSIDALFDFSLPNMRSEFLDPSTGEAVSGLPASWRIDAGAGVRTGAGAITGTNRGRPAKTIPL